MQVCPEAFFLSPKLYEIFKIYQYQKYIHSPQMQLHFGSCPSYPGESTSRGDSSKMWWSDTFHMKWNPKNIRLLSLYHNKYSMNNLLQGRPFGKLHRRSTKGPRRRRQLWLRPRKVWLQPRKAASGLVVAELPRIRELLFLSTRPGGALCSGSWHRICNRSKIYE